MRILQVITSLRIGGAEKLISDISPILCNYGHQVDVCVFDGVDTTFKQTLTDAGIKFFSFGENCNVYNPLFIFRLAKLMKGYDVVHTHNTAPQLFAALARIISSVALVTTEHTTSNRRRHWKWYAPIDRWMYKQYDKVICISNQAEINLVEFHPSLTNICTIFNGVNIQRFHQAKPINALKNSDKIVVAMVAGFRKQKDQDTLLRAFAELDDRYELWLIGDGERRGELENLTSILNQQSKVRFLGIRSDVPNLLKTADIIVMSSHYEGLSLSNIEGMSSSKPFIASDVDGLREVTSGYGILFPHGDYVQLAKIISELSNNQKYYREIADKCWERAQQFDIHKMVNSYNDIYLSLGKR